MKNWFDSKWLRFSGTGVVPFPEYPGVHFPDSALNVFWRDKLTFPPFTPRRILGEWTILDSKLVRPEKKNRIHPRVLESSSWNLNRRVASRANSAIYLWFSSNSAPNGRGCVMVYQILKKEQTAWYASFRKKALWQLDVAKDIDRKKVEIFSLIEH